MHSSRDSMESLHTNELAGFAKSASVFASILKVGVSLLVELEILLSMLI